MPKQKYIYLEHTADAKFRAFGSSLAKAFENAALAMFNLMCRTAKVKPKLEKKISVKGKDLKALLYNWLEELIFLLDSEDFLLGKLKNLVISGKEGSYNLNAAVVGDSVKKYEIFGDVKAVTYNEMLVKKEKGKSIVQVVVDL